MINGRYEINRWEISGEVKNKTKRGGPNKLVQQKFNRNYKKKEERESGTGNTERDNGRKIPLVERHESFG